MKIFKLITSALFAVAAITTANAQCLPEAHSQSADTYLNDAIGTSSFLDQAFANSRAATPFAQVIVNDDLGQPFNNALANRMVDYAAKFLGTRYVWGATGPSSFDCSGFTSYVYRNFGITINRTSSMQYTQGKAVRQVRDMQPGDLMFFSSRRSGPGRVGHVAMVVSVDRENGTCTFIHASTKKGVTYQKFPDNGYYSNHYIGAKRILGNI